MLRPGETTRSHRHTSSTVYHVFRGTGATVIDDVRYEWESGDTLSVPLWRFHHHENRFAEPAILFVLSNKPALSALGYYREEGNREIAAMISCRHGLRGDSINMKAEKPNIIEEAVMSDIIEPGIQRLLETPLFHRACDPANSRGAEFKRGPWSIIFTISPSPRDK